MAKTVPDHIFRGYDLRGVVGPDLDEERVELLAAGYATWLHGRRISSMVLGYDCRLSSPSFAEVVAKTMTEYGITVYDIGMTLSQICYWAQYHFKTRGMMMITASHNPKEYNGMKIGTGFSETMVTEEIREYRDLVKSGKFMKSGGTGKHLREDVFPLYKQDIINKVGNIGTFRVVVDSCAATTGIFLPKILRDVGLTVIEQNTTPDGNFPVGTPDPTEREVQERLAKRVKAEGADMGFSYDCDGDRVGVVDGSGNLIWNDTLVSLFARDIIDYLPGSKIVYNTLCSKQVDEVIRSAGGTPIMWMTGHSFIKSKVKEEHAVFGGELSGHFFFVDNFYGHDDGAIGTLRLLSYLTRIGQNLGEAVAQLPQYISSPEIKLGCPDAVKFDIVTNTIGREIKALYPDARYTEIDGVRMDTDEEMLVIRASQNGPYLTVKLEAKSPVMYDTLKGQVLKILKAVPEVDFKSGVNTDAFE